MSLFVEIDTLLSGLDRTVQSHRGQTFVDAPSLNRPENLMWSYRSWAQSLNLLDREVSRIVVAFYTQLAQAPNLAIRGQNTSGGGRFDRKEVCALIELGQNARAALA